MNLLKTICYRLKCWVNDICPKHKTAMSCRYPRVNRAECELCHKERGQRHQDEIQQKFDRQKKVLDALEHNS